jgi:hypothetical protein
VDRPIPAGDPGPPTVVDSAAPVPDDHPRHPAVVRTVLHPQGYVEVDGLLYRARWGGTGTPPGVGRPVEVADTGTGHLTVLPDTRNGHRNGPRTLG